MTFIFALIKLLSFLVWTLINIPLQMIALSISKGNSSYYIPNFYHKGLCFIFGLKFRIIGSPIQDKQVLYVGNHLSYLDIVGLSANLKASFIAKSEVATWPLFGFLAKLNQTGFISRSIQDVEKGSELLQNKINQKNSLIIFPEGTSTDGSTVVNFKSSLFEAFIHQNIPIQPFTISIQRANNLEPETEAIRAIYAWYGDLDLLPHLWSFAKTSGANIDLIFHGSVTVSEFKDRKQLSQHVKNVVHEGLHKTTPIEELDFNKQAA